MIWGSVRSLLGEDAFRSFLRVFLEEHKEGVFSTESFLASLRRFTGNEETVSFVSSWLVERGFPCIRVTPTEGKNGIFVSQRRCLFHGDGKASHFVIPFTLEFQRNGRWERMKRTLHTPTMTVKLPANSTNERVKLPPLLPAFVSPAYLTADGDSARALRSVYFLVEKGELEVSEVAGAESVCRSC